jgi:hypothetical protein
MNACENERREFRVDFVRVMNCLDINRTEYSFYEENMKIKPIEFFLRLCTVSLLVLGCADPTVERVTDSDPSGADSVESDSTSADSEDAGAGTDADRFSVDYQSASDISPSAPATVGIVTWSIEGAGKLLEAHIDFGLDGNYGMTAPVDLAQEGFRTILLGMKPSRTYHFQIAATDDQGEYKSADYTIETGPATDLVTLRGFTVMSEEQRERGFIIASTWRGDSSSVVYIIDADGEIVWWYETDLDGIASARMSEDGQNMWMVPPCTTAEGIRRVSMDGLDYQAYDNTVAAHDLTPVSGETMAYIDYSEADCNSIFEITPDGNNREVFEPEPYTSGSCHGNALRYSKTEDVYTLSDLNTDIYVVSRDGQFLWQLSDLVGSNAVWGYRQHGHQLLDNSFLFFANDVDVNVSAVMEYDLDGNQILDFSDGYYTRHLGDCQRLPGGNTWITYSDAESFVQEITPQGDVVLEIDARAQPNAAAANALGYTLWRDSLYGPPSDILL